MPPRTSPPSPRLSPGLSRRSALAGTSAALGAGLLGGCADRDASRDASPGATPGATPTAVAGHDVRLAARALAAEQQQVALLRAVSRRFPALAGRLRGARGVHQRHVALLTDAAPGPVTASPSGPVRVPGSPAAALRGVVNAEHALLDRHRAGAVAAASGRFARVLAGMAAAAAQQAAVLGEAR